MRTSTSTRLLAVWIPTLLLVLSFCAGGAQQEVPGVFDPLYQIYRYIESYYYKPDQITDEQALYGALSGVVKHLEDPYSEFFTPDEYESFTASLQGEFSGVGIEISIVDDRLTVITPLIGTPAEAAGVLAGDQILAIDGISTEGITITEAAVKIRGEIGTTVILTVRHEDGETEDLPIVRDTIKIDAVDSETKGDGTIGYIRLSRFEYNDTVRGINDAFGSFDLDELTGIILDLRSNPGGEMTAAIYVANLFVDKSDIVLLTEDRTHGSQRYYSPGNRVPNVPVAILINRGTASASEILAGAIRDNDMGILIGQKSFGKGVFQTVKTFADGSAVKLTTGEYFTPSGRVVNKVGLEPDIVAGEEDDPIELAIEWITAHLGMTMPFDIESDLAP